MIKLAILSSINYPFLGSFIKSLSDLEIEVECVVCEKMQLSDFNCKIIFDRLNANFVPVQIDSATRTSLFVCWDNLNSQELVNYLKKRNVNLIANFGASCILTSAIIKQFNGVLGVHPGLIPRYRGCTNVEWAIFEDEKIGNTVFFLTEEIDRGPIVLSESLNFCKDDSYRNVRTKVYFSGVRLLACGVKKAIDNGIVSDSLAMPDKGTYYKPIDSQKMQTVIAKLENGSYKYQV